MDSKPCKKCLLRDASAVDYKEIVAKHLATLKKEDLTSESEADRRLEICKQCDRLNLGTCLSCGCYVEIRAALKNGRCPKKKWSVN